MLNIEMPDDMISLSLYNIFNYRKNDRKFLKHAKNWNKRIILHIKPFYPVRKNHLKIEILLYKFHLRFK